MCSFSDLPLNFAAQSRTSRVFWLLWIVYICHSLWELADFVSFPALSRGTVVVLAVCSNVLCDVNYREKKNYIT